MEVRCADIRIDLGAQSLADADRAELVMDVARDDDFASRDALADEFWRQALVFRDLDHLLSYNALSSCFYLSHEVFLPAPNKARGWINEYTLDRALPDGNPMKPSSVGDAV